VKTTYSMMLMVVLSIRTQPSPHPLPFHSNA
jgi:hypothetical protein